MTAEEIELTTRLVRHVEQITVEAIQCGECSAMLKDDEDEKWDLAKFAAESGWTLITRNGETFPVCAQCVEEERQ